MSGSEEKELQSLSPETSEEAHEIDLPQSAMRPSIRTNKALTPQRQPPSQGLANRLGKHPSTGQPLQVQSAWRKFL